MTPRGPIGREQAGSLAGHPDGALGGCPSQVRASLTGRPGQDRRSSRAGPAQQHPPYRFPTGHRSSSSEPTHLSAPLAVDLAVGRCHSTGRFRSCRGPPRFWRAGTARAGWQAPGRGARRTGPEALRFLSPRNLGASVCLERRGDRGRLAVSGLSGLGGRPGRGPGRGHGHLGAVARPAGRLPAPPAGSRGGRLELAGQAGRCLGGCA